MNVPLTQNDWDQWGYDHLKSHRELIKAIYQKNIQKKNNAPLIEYVIYPVADSTFRQFLSWNNRMHKDATNQLRVETNDFTGVNWDNPYERQAWILNHYQNHYDLEVAAGIAS
jgi:hypothetical protein